MGKGKALSLRVIIKPYCKQSGDCLMDDFGDRSLAYAYMYHIQLDKAHILHLFLWTSNKLCSTLSFCHLFNFIFSEFHFNCSKGSSRSSGVLGKCFQTISRNIMAGFNLVWAFLFLFFEGWQYCFFFPHFVLFYCLFNFVFQICLRTAISQLCSSRRKFPQFSRACSPSQIPYIRSPDGDVMPQLWSHCKT